MSLLNGRDEFENRCYSIILEFYEKKKYDREKINLWKIRAIMKVMDLYDETQDKNLTRNALLLIISLFEDMPPDIFNNRGIHANRLADKSVMVDILKDEFSN